MTINMNKYLPVILFIGSLTIINPAHLSALQNQQARPSESMRQGCDFSKFKPIRMSSETKRIKQESKPDYPEDAKKRGVEGRVVVKVLVDPDGVVKKVCAISGDRMLRKAAENAALNFVFEPILLNGEKFSRFLEEQIVFEFKIMDK
jgi:TonB family protein